MNLDDFSTEELIGVIEKRGFIVSLTPDNDDAVVAECWIKKKYLGDSDWNWEIHTVTGIKEFVKSIKEKGNNKDNYYYHEFKKAVETIYFEYILIQNFLNS